MRRFSWLFTVGVVISLCLIASLSLGVGAAGTIELTYWTHTDDNRTEIEDRYIAEFTEMYPNVKIKRV